jgi:hypothetical protein
MGADLGSVALRPGALAGPHQNGQSARAVLTAHPRYLSRTAGDVKKGRMRAPSCRLDVLLHAG